jgi:hypothetical protein
MPRGSRLSPLHDAIKPLLQVAPSGFALFYRASTGEVLVFRPQLGIWLSICSVPSEQRRDEYRAIEWGPDAIDDLRASHFFPSRWELMTWLEQMFLAA